MLDDVKAALGITSSVFDAEITANIAAAKIDLTIGDVDIVNENDAVTAVAIKTYCKMMHELNHGSIERYGVLKDAYAAQKAQLGMKTGYTEWTR
jgi:hypothetical protein